MRLSEAILGKKADVPLDAEYLVSNGFEEVATPSGYPVYQVPMPHDKVSFLQFSYGDYVKDENWSVEILGTDPESGPFGALLVYQKDMTRGELHLLLRALFMTERQ